MLRLYMRRMASGSERMSYAFGAGGQIRYYQGAI